MPEAALVGQAFLTLCATPQEMQELKYLSHHLLLLRCIARELSQKQRSHGLNQRVNVECGYPRLGLGSQYHITSSSFNLHICFMQ